MSYDIDLEIQTGPQASMSVWSNNITSNVYPMFKKLFGEEGIKTFHDKKAGDCFLSLEAGVKEMQENRAEFEKLNSQNGWGTVEHVLPFLQGFAMACKIHRYTTIKIFS